MPNTLKSTCHLSTGGPEQPSWAITIIYLSSNGRLAVLQVPLSYPDGYLAFTDQAPLARPANIPSTRRLRPLWCRIFYTDNERWTSHHACLTRFQSVCPRNTSVYSSCNVVQGSIACRIAMMETHLFYVCRTVSGWEVLVWAAERGVGTIEYPRTVHDGRRCPIGGNYCAPWPQPCPDCVATVLHACLSLFVH